MKLQSLTPMLWTNEPEATIAFYKQHPGFVCGEKNDDRGWAGLHKDDVEIMLAKPNEHMPFDKPTFTGSLYMKTDNVEILWHRLKDSVSICYPLQTFEWGMKEFAIYDNNGYLIQLGEELIDNNLQP